MMLRGVNTAGAPVIDLGENFGLLAYDGANNFLQSIENVATHAVSRFTPTPEQLANVPDYFALYYSGMALIIELTPYVA